MVLRDISIKVRKRFPDMASIVEAGFVQPHELEAIQRVRNAYGGYWIPVHWACALVHRMRAAGRITGDPQVAGILTAIFDFKTKLQTLCNYDWVSVVHSHGIVICNSNYAIRVIYLLRCHSPPPHPLSPGELTPCFHP